MKKSITLLHVLEHLITEEDVQEILQNHGYKDTARKLSVPILLRFLVMVPTQSRSTSRHRVVEFKDLRGKIIRVVTNLYDVDAEMIAFMYQACWAIEVFFRWIKQHLNIPTLFGTTENAVFNQLYAALLAYVVLKTLYEEGKQHPFIQSASFVSFTRQFIEAQLSTEWQLIIQVFIKNYRDLYGVSLPKTG